MRSSFQLLPLFPLLLQIQLTTSQSEGNLGLYLPLSYDIPYHQQECLYERITNVNEHVTSSVFVVSGEELKASVMFEGPVAPVDVQLGEGSGDGKKFGGMELIKYLDRYSKEGMKMFGETKRGGKVKPIFVQQMLDFEGEEEHYQYDDDAFLDVEKEGEKRRSIFGDAKMKKDYAEKFNKFKEQRKASEGGEEGEGEEVVSEGKYVDDYEMEKEELLKREVDREVEFDDDFVKLQLEHEKKRDGGRSGAGGRNSEGDNTATQRHRRLEESSLESREGVESEGDNSASQSHRRLEESILVSGEPWEHTVQVEYPGWYRLCVRATVAAIEVEMELRKSSLYGRIDRRTGHVPPLEEVEIHQEIKALFENEEDPEIPQGLIKDEDLKVTREQLRVLERVYKEIISKQLQERRTWDWRTQKNQHSYSHMVIGNLLETVLYMGITGWQVYTIRKWFGGGPALGR